MSYNLRQYNRTRQNPASTILESQLDYSPVPKYDDKKIMKVTRYLSMKREEAKKLPENMRIDTVGNSYDNRNDQSISNYSTSPKIRNKY